MALSSHTLRKSVRLKVWGWSTSTLLAKSVRVVVPNTFASHSVRTGYFLKLAARSRQYLKEIRLKNYFQQSESELNYCILLFADSRSLWSSGAAMAMLLLPLKLRSGANHLLRSGFSTCQRHLLLIGGREAASDARNEGLRDAVREGGILLLPLKLPGCSGWLGDQVSKMLTVR